MSPHPRSETIEVWNLYQQHTRSLFCGAFNSATEWKLAIARAMEQKRRKWRVRRFWDRHEREWVIQLIVGTGYGIR